MARRVIKGIGQLNPAPIVLPTFKEFFKSQTSGEFTDHESLRYGHFGQIGRVFNHPAYRVVQGYGDIRASAMNAQTYPVGWVYKDFFPLTPHSTKIKEQQSQAAGLALGHALRRETNAVIFLVPYIDNRYGLVLILCLGNVIRANPKHLTVSCEGITFVIGYHDVVAMKEVSGPNVSWFWLDRHYSHARMSYLVDQYRQIHGEYPLYKETLAAFEEHRKRQAAKDKEQ